MESERVPLMASSSVLMLVGAGRVLARRVEAELAGLGLTLRHLGALGHLVHRPDLSYSDLARRAGVTAQSMHATVRGLEELGAVQRALPGQGHRARLEVTDRGRELLDRVRASVERLDEELLADLTEEQRAALRAALRSLVVPAGPGPSLAP